MPDILHWPDEFDHSTPATGFDEGFVTFLEEMCDSGTSVLADRHWALFEFCRGERCIHFIRRGRSCNGRVNRQMYWEVVPTEDGSAHRLGPLFGIREFACVVVCGLPDIRLLTARWLGGARLVDAVRGVTLWDRVDPSTPLVPVVPR